MFVSNIRHMCGPPGTNQLSSIFDWNLQCLESTVRIGTVDTCKSVFKICQDMYRHVQHIGHKTYPSEKLKRLRFELRRALLTYSFRKKEMQFSSLNT